MDFLKVVTTLCGKTLRSYFGSWNPCPLLTNVMKEQYIGMCVYLRVSTNYARRFKACQPTETKGVFTLWTMKSSLAPLKYVIGCWTCSGPLWVIARKKKCKSDHETWGLQKHDFRPTLSSAVVQHVLQWKRQKRFLFCKCQGTVAKKCCFHLL